MHGDMDDDTSPALARALTAAANSDSTRTVVDPSPPRFADSSALHALLTARQAHTTTGTTLVLAGPVQAPVHRLSEVTNTGPVFPLGEKRPAGDDILNTAPP
ncbi:STAS domain-containing protein [Streptomyces sp. NPDC058623]|uniref:STAS domain-containing protein n=1 Tax=Streptomyces sp. NPDC058623 TaxID=3346563 RepID=UPI003663E982